MPIELVGPFCSRRGCGRQEWKDGLCSRCWRFAEVFGKPPALVAYDPADGYRGERDSVELPWAEWESRARELGVPIADLLAGRPEPDPPFRT